MSATRPSLGERMSATDQKFHDLMREVGELLGPAQEVQREKELQRMLTAQQHGGKIPGSAGRGGGSSLSRGSTSSSSSTPNVDAQHPSAHDGGPSGATKVLGTHNSKRLNDTATANVLLVGSASGKGASLDRPHTDQGSVGTSVATNGISPSIDGTSPPYSPHPSTSNGSSVSRVRSQLQSADSFPGGRQGFEVVPAMDFSPGDSSSLGAVRPASNSASSFRELVASARLAGGQANQEASEETKGEESVRRTALDEEHAARERQQQQRLAQRQERQRRREEMRKKRDTEQEQEEEEEEASSTACAVPSAAADEGLAPSQETRAQAHPPPGPTPEEIEAQKREEAEMALKAEQQRIKEEARRRREDRLKEEREQAEREAQAEVERLRLWEVLRDLTWNETVSRSDLTAEEDEWFKELRVLYRCARTDLIELNAVERVTREHLEPSLFPVLHIFALDEAETREKILRTEMKRQGMKHLLNLFRICQDEATRLFMIQREDSIRAELLEEENNTWEENLMMRHGDEVSIIVERELWRVNVGEAEGRMVLEKEEAEFFLICLDGSTSSRQRVQQHAAAVLVAREELKAYYAEKVKELVDAELSERIMFQVDESSTFDSTIGGPSRTSYRAAAEAEQMRHKESVEQAIRESQMYRSHHGNDVVYQQSSAPMFSVRTVVAKKNSAAPTATAAVSTGGSGKSGSKNANKTTSHKKHGPHSGK